MKKIRAVLFDMIGTTVLEKDPTVIASCFKNAFHNHFVKIDNAQIREVRGMNKMEAIGRVLTSSNGPVELQSRIFESFKNSLLENVSNFEEHPNLNSVISQLRERKIIIGIASGLPLVLFQMLYENLKWEKYSLEYVNVYETFPKGRPNPALIFDMCREFQIPATQLLKVGDTIADIEEGKNAGSVTAALLVGTQPDSLLQNANPDFALRSLGDVVNVLN